MWFNDKSYVWWSSAVLGHMILVNIGDSALFEKKQNPHSLLMKALKAYLDCVKINFLRCDEVYITNRDDNFVSHSLY